MKLKNYPRTLMSLVAIAIGLNPTGTHAVQATAEDSGWVSIFNGKDFTNGFYIYSNGYIPIAGQSKFNVENGMIHAGGPYSLLVTSKEYSYYKVRVNYKFGANVGGGANAGLMILVDNEAALTAKALRPRSIEINCRRDNGYPWTLWAADGQGPLMSTTAKAGTSQFQTQSDGGVPYLVDFTKNRVLESSYPNPEIPAGQWNHGEAWVYGDSGLFYLNNQLRTSTWKWKTNKNGVSNRVAKGGIGVQTEGSDIWYANWEIQELDSATFLPLHARRGCTDPKSLKYDAHAVIADGSCNTTAIANRSHVNTSIRDFDGSNPESLPKLLSLTGLYENVAAKTKIISAGIKSFEVNAPLWSDGSAKQRFVDLPLGTKITPTDSDQYVIPDKTVFIKNFMIDTVYGDSSSRILIETRFLVVRKDPNSPKNQYLGLTYKWRRDQLEAELLDPSQGLDTAIVISLHGKKVGKRWTYPSGNDCKQCHQGRGTLGFITPQLNRPDALNPALNQLKTLFTAGILSSDIYKPSLHRWTGLKETGVSATSESKARSYLAANCSHCHGNKIQLEGSEHDFDFFTATKKFKYSESPSGYVGRPTAKVEGFTQIIYPGFPESSYVMFRMKSRGDLSFRGLAQMPPMATFQIDSSAVKTMQDWICSMSTKTRNCSQPEIQDDASFWESMASLRPKHGMHPKLLTMKPRLEHGLLMIPNFSKISKQIHLYTTEGKEISIRQLKPGLWILPNSLKHGLYFLKTDNTVASVTLPYP
jgi:hypothetical protein